MFQFGGKGDPDLYRLRPIHRKVVFMFCAVEWVRGSDAVEREDKLWFLRMIVLLDSLCWRVLFIISVASP